MAADRNRFGDAIGIRHDAAFGSCYCARPADFGEAFAELNGVVETDVAVVSTTAELDFDPVAENFPNDGGANTMLGYTRRAPYTI